MMTERFWRVHGHLARAWYELEYGRVEPRNRWYQLGMDFLQSLAHKQAQTATMHSPEIGLMLRFSSVPAEPC
jgi:hypothetical protein